VRRAWLGLAVLLVLLAALPEGSQAATKKPKGRAKAKSAKPAPATFDVKLPVLGTRLAEFPPGEGKSVADSACLACHSTDLVRQQRLTEKQWTASLTKMIGWGAEVPESRKEALLAYLVKNFGPDNDRFEPVITRPVGR
jgi:quinoprotein glucose dehydrogenase